MKKYVSFLLAALLLVSVLFAGCHAPGTVGELSSEVTGTDTTTSEETASVTTTTLGQTTSEESEPEKPVSVSKKILAIGNSFSVDAMEHLAEILVGEGYTDFLLGNLYVGGCSLDLHKTYMDGDYTRYTFYVNTGSGWTAHSKKTIQYGLAYADWDVITIQQASGSSGLPDTYSNLQYIVDYVRKTVTTPDLKIFWHMTWAYQGDSNHNDFSKYNSDQMTMYNAIVSTVKEQILTNDTIDGIIPSGTAIQNLRTSYLGDTLTRDGYHLSNDIGRYTAALIWYKQLMGADLTDLTVTPAAFPNVERHLPAIKEAVNNAFKTPFAVTNATVTGSVGVEESLSTLQE